MPKAVLGGDAVTAGVGRARGMPAGLAQLCQPKATPAGTLGARGVLSVLSVLGQLLVLWAQGPGAAGSTFGVRLAGLPFRVEKWHDVRDDRGSRRVPNRGITDRSVASPSQMGGTLGNP
jgi:hypothetical protein